MKTGYTESAGYCLVSSAERDEMRLIAVVLGTSSPSARANESQALLNYGFRFFESHKLWDAGEVISNIRVWKGDSDSTQLIVRDPVYVTVPRGSAVNIQTEVKLPQNIVAPLNTIDTIGTVRATLGADTLIAVPVFSASNIEVGSVFSTLWDELLLWFE